MELRLNNETRRIHFDFPSYLICLYIIVVGGCYLYIYIYIYEQGLKTHIRGWSSLIFIGVNIPAFSGIPFFHDAGTNKGSTGSTLCSCGKAEQFQRVSLRLKRRRLSKHGAVSMLISCATMPTDTEQNSPNKKMVDGFAKSKPAQTSMLVKPHV